MMNFRILVEKTPDANLLRETISFAAERPMEIAVGALSGAPYGERSLDWLVQRTFYSDRIFEPSFVWSLSVHNIGR